MLTRSSLKLILTLIFVMNEEKVYTLTKIWELLGAFVCFQLVLVHFSVYINAYLMQT